ncbi:hypothetical protein Q2P25_001424 [Escherichia coli]|nr:hypothetical protein [Escherichia coli]ELM7795842.1 hypothetical protein [Escherichia coli]ELM7805793.1 hypothetical protein [Escherichia coli]ELM7810065.1 hypothetical protein [Escherichia coli]ELM7815399.1 hypothetical protein [Escherichia coli]
MSVKRYEFELYHCNGGEMLVSDTGDYVSYEDYAALEARCAALAAENARLKAAIETHKHGFVRCNCCGDELMCHTDDVCRALDDTPATDAYLAEVRASAVDEVCLKISNAIPNCYQDELVGLDMAAGICGDFASEIRKGVQS